MILLGMTHAQRILLSKQNYRCWGRYPEAVSKQVDLINFTVQYGFRSEAELRFQLVVSSRDELLSFMDALLIGNSDGVHDGANSQHLCAAATGAGVFLCDGLNSVSWGCYLLKLHLRCSGSRLCRRQGWRFLSIDDAWPYCTCWWMEVTISVYLWCQSETSADLSTTWLWNEVWVSPMI